MSDSSRLTIAFPCSLCGDLRRDLLSCTGVFTVPFPSRLPIRLKHESESGDDFQVSWTDHAVEISIGPISEREMDHFGRPDSLLQFAVSLPRSDDEHVQALTTSDLNESCSLPLRYIPSIESLKSLGYEVLLCCYIANPEGVSANRGMITLANQPLANTSAYRNPIIREACEDAHNRGWPPIRQLDLKSTISWLRGASGFNEGAAKGQIGRAVGALAHMLAEDIGGRNRDAMASIWAILGIESIYGGKENTGIGTQIIQKSEALLGVRKTHKKALSAAYRFRSSFLHGSVDYYLPHTQSDDHPDLLKYDREAYESCLAAIGLLISSIQEFALRNKYSIEFRTVVDE